MNEDLRRQARFAVWAFVLAAAVASAGVCAYKFGGLPQLGLTLGPDLHVRSVSNEKLLEAETPKFKRGDRILAIEGNAVEDLRDLRVLLQSLPREQILGKGDGEKGVRYRLVRPRHRFSLLVDGERDDPTALPESVDPTTDRLVEIDGRLLPEPIGPEGIRSVIASRPDALLTFERRDAVFQGHVAFQPSSVAETAVAVFVLALLLAGAFWQYRERSIDALTAGAVGFETLCVAWMLLLAVAYQWILADPVLTSAVAASLVLVRPAALTARTLGAYRNRELTGPWAVGAGIVYAALVVALFNTGNLADAESALLAAAAGAGLYLIYELFLVVFEDVPHLTLQSGRGYLAGITVVWMVATALVWYVGPEGFRENYWRWFTIGFLTVVWFGDALFCLRGPSGASWGRAATSEERQRGLSNYLELVEKELDESDVMLVVQSGDASVTIQREVAGLEIEPSSSEIADLVEIMVRERARLPLSEEAERAGHPLAGMAQTMEIVLALPLQPPSGGMQLPETDIALVAIETSGAGDLPSFASAETMDFVQAELSPTVWTSAFVEGTSELADVAEGPSVRSVDSADGAEGETDAEGPPAAEVEEERERLEEELEHTREKLELLREDRSGLAEELQFAHRRLARTEHPLDHHEQLLESELIDSLEYLLETDEPIVLAGPRGAGKEYVGRVAARLEGRPDEGFVLFDAFEVDSEDHRRELFGGHTDEPETERGLVDTAVGGSLFVRHADRLADTLMVGLCNAADDEDVRIFFSVDRRRVREQSALDGRPGRLVDRLEHREVVLPGLARRPTIRQPLLEHYLRYFADLRGKPVEAFSEGALEVLDQYAYPGDILEAKLVVDLAVMRASGSTVEFEDLDPGVREAVDER